MIFGTAGIPIRCKLRSTIEGIECVNDLQLQAMEMEFVQGVRMKEEAAREVRRAAEKFHVKLSIHAPYYINLLSEDKYKRDASRIRIIDSCKIGSVAGAERIVIHAAFYGKMEKKKAFEEMNEQTALILDELKKRKIENSNLSYETMGKHGQFGTIEELYSLSKEFGIERLNPCIDFGHLHARTNGGMKSKKDFLKVLSDVESYGKKYLQSLHIHFEGIEFSEKGERRHLPIASKSPDFKFLAEALIEKNCSGTIICESPEIENDALEMMKMYEKFRGE